jgi:hypothetical protein
MFWNLHKFVEYCKSSAYSQKRREQEVSNYRPVSILPAFSKILEILIYNRVVTFLNKHNMIYETQNGFREKKFTNTAIQTFIEDI